MEKILVVDDEQKDRRIVEKILTRLGHTVVLANSGEAAWELLQDENIRFVITGVNLSGMGGIQLIKNIRSADFPEYIYILLITSNNTDEDIVEGQSAGADDYLAKPINPTTLEARVALGQKLLTLKDSLIQSDNKLEKLTMVDVLTGLLNRRAIYKFARGEVERARRYSDSISMVFLCLDDLKKINDEHGNHVGDDALKAVTKIIKERLRPYDGIGRWSFDEFLVVLPGASAINAEKVAIRIVEGIAAIKLALPESGHLSLRSNAGVASVTRMTGSVTLLDDQLQLASEALNRAKEDGDSQVQTSWL
ncbi:MAG: diguanylate cyclase [Anaerolineales bacterium]|uniref:Diguanylate cyclase n=1 Tax=Candidatus Desulfolinea nitratireducens TaxID=2841698 RepID=A0A8J6TIK3_9CHLR|nr:diguanylate cyclase [Candidatus Desulfolinea nitratireducens]MBL6959839.1 diguanylate cyclase [Anaerolineales bacterium]